MSVPIISVAMDPDEGDYFLEATSYQRTAPAGDRLFRGGEFPLINWRHQSREEAERDRAALQRYVDTAFGGKSMSKAKLRKQGAD